MIAEVALGFLAGAVVSGMWVGAASTKAMTKLIAEHRDREDDRINAKWDRVDTLLRIIKRGYEGYVAHDMCNQSKDFKDGYAHALQPIIDEVNAAFADEETDNDSEEGTDE